MKRVVHPFHARGYASPILTSRPLQAGYASIPPGVCIHNPYYAPTSKWLCDQLTYATKTESRRGHPHHSYGRHVRA